MFLSGFFWPFGVVPCYFLALYRPLPAFTSTSVAFALHLTFDDKDNALLLS